MLVRFHNFIFFFLKLLQLEISDKSFNDQKKSEKCHFLLYDDEQLICSSLPDTYFESQQIRPHK